MESRFPVGYDHVDGRGPLPTRMRGVAECGSFYPAMPGEESFSGERPALLCRRTNILYLTQHLTFLIYS